MWFGAGAGARRETHGGAARRAGWSAGVGRGPAGGKRSPRQSPGRSRLAPREPELVCNVVFRLALLQLCTGGSVTDLVQGLKQRGARLSDDQIGYILRETVEVSLHFASNPSILFVGALQ